MSKHVTLCKDMISAAFIAEITAMAEATREGDLERVRANMGEGYNSEQVWGRSGWRWCFIGPVSRKWRHC